MTAADVRRWIGALAIIAVVLVFPDNPWDFDVPGLAHAPWELVVIVLLPRVLPQHLWTWARPIMAGILTLTTIIKVANVVALQGFGRPVAPLADLALVPTALGTLAMNNRLIAIAAVAGAAVLVAAVAAATWWALGVLGRISRGRVWLPVAAGLMVVTVALSFVTTGDPPIAIGNAATSRLMRDQAVALEVYLRDMRAFRHELEQPENPKTPALLSGLRGTDVLVVFIESYGRSALERAPYDAIVRPALDQSTQALTAAGFHASSAWLTSPTFGGESWLAHSTVTSGLPVTTDPRYRALINSNRSTLVGDFKRAGWRTTVVMPEITLPWPEIDFFGFDAVYTALNLGYRGPPFGYMTMPDQYVLHAFNTRELAKADRPPLMAEIALISSHIPWAPIPRMVPWSDIGDGAIFATARTPKTAREEWADPARVPVIYAETLEYVLQAVTSFITTYGSDNTLVILMGDHQPMGFIAGEGASHQVPVHLIARDETLLRALDGGSWAAGMTPASTGPVMGMDALRAHIVTTFTPRE